MDQSGNASSGGESDSNNTVTPDTSGSQPAVVPTAPAPVSETPKTEIITGSQLAKSGGKKKLGLVGIIAIAVAVVLGGSAAAYFGVVVPNKPENVWKKALSNTGKGYDKLIEYADNQKDVKGYKLKGNFKLEGAVAADGKLESKSDEKKSITTGDVGFAGSRVDFEMRTIIPENATFPDVYVKVSGTDSLAGLLEATGDTEMVPLLAEIEGKFISIDHSLFDTLQGQMANSGTPDITPEEVIKIAEEIGRVNKEYLFSTEENKAVLRVAEEVGKEDKDGRSVYHFKVTYNKNNLKAYATALKDAIKETKIKDLLPEGQTLEEALSFDELLKEIDALPENGDTLDVYVDMKTKLIRAVQFPIKDKPNDLFEIGLDYNGGDEYPLVIRIKGEEGSSKGNGTITLSLNTKSNVVTFKADASIEDSGQSQTFKSEFVAEPSNESVDVEKPSDSTPITELFGGLFGGGLGGGGFGGATADADLMSRCTAAFEAMANNNGAGDIPAECDSLFGESF